MKLNISFNKFKKNHLQNNHQVLFKSRNCKEYYKLSIQGLIELQYVQTRQEWNDASWFPSKPFFPYPIGFDT